MGLETATYINQLVITNPDGLDQKSQGDDHIRLVKKALKNTFPNITGVVTATQADLNKTSDASNFCFPGMIVMWSGTIGTIPSGWKLCNGVGTISTGGSVPDLRNRFISATDGTVGGAVNSTGGSNTQSISGSTGGTALTIDQMPAHNHAPVNTPPFGLITTANDGGPIDGGVSGGPKLTAIQTQGGGQPHSHTISGTVSVVPRYYALAFLIKN